MDTFKERFTQAFIASRLSNSKAAIVANLTVFQFKAWKQRIMHGHHFQPSTMARIEEAVRKIEEFNNLDKAGKDLHFPQLPRERVQRKYLHKAAIHMSTDAWLKLESLRGNLNQGEYLERLILAA